MPVGRFVLDVHGEDRATWAASDALCAALQVINHLQDCGKDYRDIDRVYIPADMLAPPARRRRSAPPRGAAGAARRDPRPGAALRPALLAEARPFAAMIRDRRLAAEVRGDPAPRRGPDRAAAWSATRWPSASHHGQAAAQAWLALTRGAVA